MDYDPFVIDYVFKLETLRRKYKANSSKGFCVFEYQKIKAQCITMNSYEHTLYLSMTCEFPSWYIQKKERAYRKVWFDKFLGESNVYDHTHS